MTPIGSTGDDDSVGNVGTGNFSEVRVNVGTTAVLGVALRSGRRSVLVSNVGTTILEVSQNPSFTFGTGDVILPGQSLPIETQAAVYLVSDAAGGQAALQETY
jgi:hypothetical protein